MAKKTTKTEKNLEEKRSNKAGAQLKKTEKEKIIKTRGRVFQGTVIRKFPKRVVIEFERMVYIRKYERYSRTKTKIHARLPESIENKIKIGDLIKVQECRPLSKIIHFIVIEKVKDASEFQGGQTIE